MSGLVLALVFLTFAGLVFSLWMGTPEPFYPTLRRQKSLGTWQRRRSMILHEPVGTGQYPLYRQYDNQNDGKFAGIEAKRRWTIKNRDKAKEWGIADGSYQLKGTPISAGLR